LSSRMLDEVTVVIEADRESLEFPSRLILAQAKVSRANRNCPVAEMKPAR
jgi:hypothetical protein